MSQEILEKAIKKAVANGWRPNQGVSDFPTIAKSVDGKSTLEIGYISQPQLFIFNHDFAKALWGEKTVEMFRIEGVFAGQLATWKHRLQQMIVADDPIAYLGEHL